MGFAIGAFNEPYVGNINEHIRDQVDDIMGRSEVGAPFDSLFENCLLECDWEDAMKEHRDVNESERHLGGARWYQFQAAIKTLLIKRQLLADECGLGKTVEVCIFVNLLHMIPNGEVPTFIVCAPDAIVAKQWQKALLKFCGLYFPIIGASDVEGYKDSVLNGHGCIVNHKMLSNHNSALADTALGGCMTRKVAFILDESACVKNRKSLTYQRMQIFAQHVEYLVMCNATAYEMQLEDMFTQFNLLEPEILHNVTWMRNHYVTMGKRKIWKGRGKYIEAWTPIGYHDQDAFRVRVKWWFISRGRKELGLEEEDWSTVDITAHIVDLSVEQKAYCKSHKSKSNWDEALNCPMMLDGCGLTLDGSPKVEEFCRVYGAPGVTGVMVYCFHIRTCDYLADRLRSLGKSVGVINGSTKPSDRLAAVEGFNSGTVDILITNTVKGMDLDGGSGVVIMSPLGNPARVLQVLSRIRRGTSDAGKTFDIFCYRTWELGLYKNAFESARMMCDFQGTRNEFLFNVLGKLNA